MTQENTPAVSDAAASSDVAEATPTPKRRTTRRSSRAKTAPAAEETATLTASPATDAAPAAADNGDAQASDAAATAPRKPARRSSRRNWAWQFLLNPSGSAGTPRRIPGFSR